MASFNKVILLGNLTRDPQFSYLPSGTPLVEFSVATNRKFVGQDGQQREEVCFTDCRMFGKRAEVINKYFKKGSSILVEGRLILDSWTTQDGSKRSRLRVQAENFEFTGGGGGGSQRQGDYQQGGYQQPYQQQPPQNNQPQQPPQQSSSDAFGGGDDFNPDDIPF
ncbi:Helix-destabilizing protein [Sedimentisphaera cyanobacteriorum]|uniref:Single-stranded DNA-binding protein n=1 Tax=Sedimentisphaera cyanobacteriorum TaxID=1940790 RepID=A0A1Q2HMG8_9BACT|nr:single-stranded DNA-binding protein [Sedimentisphaera cyanobacteriorum]AQQ08628.1 Helix-destabilizing protein [Sedimentisphaera cyanobacteriorum]